MFPTFSIYNQADVTGRNPEATGNLCQREIFSRVFRSNISDKFFRQFGLWQLRAFRRSWGKKRCAKRRIDRSVYRPPTVDPVSQNIVTDSSAFCERHHRHCFPHISKHVVAGAVVALRFIQHPSAVCRFIVAIVVNSIQGVLLGGLVAHIKHEAFKTRHPITSFFPTHTDFNSSATVPFVFGEVLVPASREHHRPLSISWMRAWSRLVISRHLQYIFSGLLHSSVCGSSSERQSRLTAGACASSHKLTHAST